MQGDKIFWRTFFILIIFFGTTFFLVIDYTRHSKSFIQEQTYLSVEKQTKMMRNNFQQRLEERLLLLDTFAAFIAKDEFSIQMDSYFREDINEIYDFEQVGIARNKTGIVEFGDGKSINISNKKIYQNALRGKSGIDYFLEGMETTSMLIFATPIYNDGNIEDVLIATTSSDFLEKQRKFDFLGENKYVFLTNQQGDILSVGHGYDDFLDENNIFEYLNGQDVDAAQIMDNMNKHMVNSFSYFEGEENWNITYMPLGINDWYIFCMTPNNAIGRGQGKLESFGTGFLLKMLLVFAVGIIFVYLFLRNAAALKMENEFLKMAQDVAGAISFKGDYKKDAFVFNGNYFELFGRDPFASKISELEKPHPFILEEDQEAFLKMGRELIAGKEKGNAQYRFVAMDGSIHWHQFVYRVWFDRRGLPRECYGMIIPIDQQMKEISKLQMQVEKDPLTGVLNRMAFEFYVNHCFSGELKEDSHALLLLDLDDFKQINDGYGHVLGDHALITTAGILKTCVRNSDYVGRLGGDEFAVFLKSVSQEQAAKKAGEICEALEKAEMKSNEAMATCSIGIACFPKDGSDFNELYQRADRGLYKVKGTGKNNYCVVD